MCGLSLPLWPPRPLRVVLDGRGRLTEPGHPTLDPAIGPTLLFTTQPGLDASGAAWKALGVEAVVVPAGPDGAGCDLESCLRELARRGVSQLCSPRRNLEEGKKRSWARDS